MDPFILSLILGGGGGLLSGLSGLFSEKTMPENINAELTQQFTDLVTAMQESAQANLDQSLLDSSRVASQIGQTAAKQGQVTEKIGKLQAPGADDWFKSFTQKYVPAYQAMAEQTATEATRMDTAQERANLLSERAVTDALSKYAGGAGYSGAAVQAATSAAAAPQLDYLTAVDQMFGQAYGNTFNQLASQGQQLSFQGQQNEFLNNLQKLTSQLGGYGQQGQTLGTQMSGSLQQAGIYSQQQQNLLNQLAQLSQPVYATPSYTESPMAGIGTAVSGIGQLVGAFGSNQQNQNLINQLAALLGGGQGQQGITLGR